MRSRGRDRGGLRWTWRSRGGSVRAPEGCPWNHPKECGGDRNEGGGTWRCDCGRECSNDLRGVLDRMRVDRCLPGRVKHRGQPQVLAIRACAKGPLIMLNIGWPADDADVGTCSCPACGSVVLPLRLPSAEPAPVPAFIVRCGCKSSRRCTPNRRALAPVDTPPWLPGQRRWARGVWVGLGLSPPTTKAGRVRAGVGPLPAA